MVDQLVLVPIMVNAGAYTIDFVVRNAPDLLYGVQLDDLLVTSITAPASAMTSLDTIARTSTIQWWSESVNLCTSE